MRAPNYPLKIPFAFCLLVSCAVAQAASAIVNVGGDNPPTFSPASITITKGDTVTFINKGGLHNVVADDNSFRCAHGCDGSGGNGAASLSTWVVSLTFNTPGTIGYYCEIHGSPGQGMFGTITVNAPTPVRLQSFEVD
jgi:plastocyanin